MGHTKNYIEFIIDNVVKSFKKVQLLEPRDNDEIYCVIEGRIVYIDVIVEVVEIYTRSIKLKITFDKYEKQELFFISVKVSPKEIEYNLNKKLVKLIYHTFLEDGRREEIIQKYRNMKNYKFD